MSDSYPNKYIDDKTLLDTSCLLFVLQQELIYLNIRHGMCCFVVSSLYQRHENEVYWMLIVLIMTTPKRTGQFTLSCVS
jgi:hypothetical protein